MFVLSVLYFFAGIIYLFQSKYFMGFLYGFAGIWFLHSAIINRNSYFNKYILFNDDKIELKKSIFKSSHIFWDKIILIKSSASSIEFKTQNDRDVVLSLDWMDYPVVKEIKQVLAEFCTKKNIRVEYM
jgi:hypothetical protein